MKTWLLVLALLAVPSVASAQFFATPPNTTCANDPRILNGTITLPNSPGRVACLDSTNTVRIWTGFRWSQPVMDSCTFATLGTTIILNGSLCYCTDCTIAATCAGAGTGAIAKRINSVAVCN